MSDFNFGALSASELEAAFRAHTPMLEAKGVHFMEGLKGYIHPSVKNNFGMAMDAQPGLVTTSSAGIPAFLSNWLDPDMIKVMFAPNRAAQIVGEEVQKGNWVTETAMFPIVENVGEVSSYGDWSESGSTDVNVNFPQRQSYHYQTVTQWGERQLDRWGLARINYASEINVSSVVVLNKFQNNTYFFGVNGLYNYGLLNDPSLSAPIQPGIKAAGGRTWAVATANEIWSDIQAMFKTLVAQSTGLIEATDKLTMALDPSTAVYLTNTNSFNVSVNDLIKKNFPNLRIETAVQYTSAAGNLVQMIAPEVEGQKTAMCGYTEKMRAHPVIRLLSAFKQKKSQGTWGTIIRQPFAIAAMLGV